MSNIEIQPHYVVSVYKQQIGQESLSERFVLSGFDRNRSRTTQILELANEGERFAIRRMSKDEVHVLGGLGLDAYVVDNSDLLVQKLEEDMLLPRDKTEEFMDSDTTIQNYSTSSF